MFKLNLTPEQRDELNGEPDPEQVGAMTMTMQADRPLSSLTVLPVVARPDHALHGLFEWQDHRAAARWRFWHPEPHETDGVAAERWRHRQVSHLVEALELQGDEDDPIPLFGSGTQKKQAHG